MMSKKQLAAMLTLHVTYLLLGASIFYYIESPLEMAKRAQEKLEQLEIQALLLENYVPADEDKQSEILEKLSEYCGKPMVNATLEEAEGPIKWDFYHSFFFSYTVISTIGYGNLAPTTSFGRILMIFYALVGIPINGILLANLGEYFGRQFVYVYKNYKRNHEARVNKLDYQFHRLGMFGQITLYLIPGFLFFIFLPACLFVQFEGWDYVLAVYYAFVTLTTIGFGDYVAGTANRGFGIYFVFYQIFLIVWITFGLGYLAMLLGFITRGLRSKKFHELEHKIVANIKATQNRILGGFSKDVNYLRRIINEANLMSVKPVYHDELDDFPRLFRSSSCPELTFDTEPRTPAFKRKRANSDNFYITNKDMLRIQSDTDLLGIDRKRTFSGSPIVKPAEILARVVNALGAIPTESDDDEEEERGAVNMFSDKDILASEKKISWAIGVEPIAQTPKFKRSRAFSVAVPNSRKTSYGVWPPIEMNVNGSPKRGGKLSLPIEPVMTNENEEDEIPKSSNLLTKLNPFKQKRDSDAEKGFSPADYLKKTVRGRMSMFTGGADAYKEKTKSGRDSLFKSSRDESDTDSPRLDDVKNYQNKTRQGRGSLFAEDLERYQVNTTRGRPSLFGADISAYKSKTKKGRLSFLSHEEEDNRRPSLSEMKEEEQVEALENTSVADLIRALALIRAGNEVTGTPSTRRKQGTTQPPIPDLLDLLGGAALSHPSPTNRTNVRRGSLRPLDAGETPSLPLTGSGRRRMSVRPIGNFLPVLETVRSGQELDSINQPRQRNVSIDSPPPPYSPIKSEVPRQRRFTPTSEDGMRFRKISPASGGPVARKISRTGLFANLRSEDSLEEVPTPSGDSRSRQDSLNEIKIDEYKKT